MTITVAPARNELTANAGQTIFNYTFKIFSITDLNVYITPAGQNANDSTDLTTAYTVLGVGDEDGGTITLTVGATLNDLITIVSNTPSSRTTDYQNNGDFRPDTVNADFDRVVSLVKKIEDSTNRSLLSPQSKQGPKPLSLPEPVIGELLRWNDTLSGLENISLSELPVGTFPVDRLALNYSTLAAWQADTSAQAGDVATTAERSTDNGGGATGEVISGIGTANGFNRVQHGTLSLTWVLRDEDGRANMLEWGLVGNGAVINTGSFDLIYPIVKTLGLSTYFPEGTFRGQFTFDGDSPVNCAGMRVTKFTPSSTDFAVRLFGEGNAALGATLRDCSITGGGGAGTGLLIGNAGAASSASNALLNRIEIDGFSINWDMVASVMSNFKNVYSFNATLDAIRFGSERNVTTIHFDTCRFRLSDVGVNAQSGHNVVWTNCNIESNRVTGVKIFTGITSGPTSWVFNGGDIEDNGAGADAGEIAAFLNAGVYIDMQASIGLTKPQNVIFNRTVCGSASDTLDVSVIRGEYILFDHCAFTILSLGGFTSSKFHFNAGTSAVRVHLEQCGTIQDLPSKTLYANFPALSTGADGPFGFTYAYQSLGRQRSNVLPTKWVTITTTTDLQDFDIMGVNCIIANTASGTVNIESLDDGVVGQQVSILKPSGSNDIVVKHNGLGLSKIFTPAGANVTLSNRQGYSLVFDGSQWLSDGQT